jgi:hypothetical protein
LLAFLAVLALQPQAATAQQTKPAVNSGFSFAAYGDSRPMIYLPPKAGQPDLVKLFVEMFGLVMPEKENAKFTLNRFRPWSAEPFGTVELFK